MRQFKPGDIVKHFKREMLSEEEKKTDRYLYRIMDVAEHTESGEKLMIYQALYGSCKIYARPFEMFMGKVDREKYPDVTQTYRFEKISAEVKEDELFRKYEFRSVLPEEAEEAAGIEQICFPPNEACKREHMLERINVASDLFFVAVDRESGKIAGFLNGIATNTMEFRDEFFTDAALHDPDGQNIMLLGLDVLPEYRGQGLARELVFQYCHREAERGRKRMVLTCRENKVKMYRKLGFRDLGESGSVWGGEKWHEMDIILAQ